MGSQQISQQTTGVSSEEASTAEDSANSWLMFARGVVAAAAALVDVRAQALGYKGDDLLRELLRSEALVMSTSSSWDLGLCTSLKTEDQMHSIKQQSSTNSRWIEHQRSNTTHRIQKIECDGSNMKDHKQKYTKN